MASHGQPQSILDPRVFLGCKLSVISNADIRYEGTLFSYNEIESTLALQYVHSFGTEDRRVEKIPPSSEMFEIIIFRVADIKDLEVCDAPAKVAEIRNTVDPAIVRTEKSGATTVKTPVLASSASAKPLNLKIHPGAIMAFFLQQQLNAANSGTGNSNRQGNTRRRGRARAASQGTGGAGINRGQQSGATANGGGGRNNLNGGGGSGNGGPGGNGMRSGGPLNSGNMRNNAAQNNLHLRLSKEYQNVVYEPTAAASVAEPLGPNSTGAQDQDLMEFSLAAVSFDMFDKIYAQKVRELYGSGPGKEDGLDENKDPKQYYDPQGFFDKISSDAMADDTISRLAVRSRKEEREMNAQTFGVATSFGGQQNGGGQNGSQGGSGGQNQGGMGRRGNNNRGRGGNMGNNSGGGGQNGGGGNRTGNGNNNGGGNRSGGGGNGQMRGRQGGNQFGGRSQQRGGYGGRGFRGGRFGRNNMNNNNNNNRGNRSMGGSFNGGAGNGIPDGLKDLLQRYLPNLPMDALFELQAQQSQQNNNNSDGASGHVDWTFPIGPEVDYDVVQGGGSRGMEVSVQ